VCTDDVQLPVGEAGYLVTVTDDGRMQRTVLEIGIADVDGGQDVAAFPGRIGFHHEHGAGAITQQLPVFGGKQCAFERAVRNMLLDHQSAAFGLLHGDDGLVKILMPRLLDADLMAFACQSLAQRFEIGAVIVLVVADQQMQT